jgi:hypothetical protein
LNAADMWCEISSRLFGDVYFTSSNFDDAARQVRAERSFLLLTSSTYEMSDVFTRDSENEVQMARFWTVTSVRCLTFAVDIEEISRGKIVLDAETSQRWIHP